ncbi:MAG: ATP synthase F1 subunit delta [Bacteroidales bacterium]|nr:ATP synthase F1 subunit delta [Bacteroidales bacterium]MBN2756688.1 ATP synthase F1 subunit delta [Bacteroidales bacterium]
MNYSAIAVRYSKALFILADEKNVLAKVYDDMKLIHEICEAEHDFVRLLENPVVPFYEKTKIFENIFAKKINTLSLQFLKLITKNRRENYLKHMAFEYINLYKAKLGIKTVTLTSVELINENLKQEIKNIIEKQYKADVELIEKTDAELIGGFVLRIDDEQYDASVVNQLERIKREFINN